MLTMIVWMLLAASSAVAAERQFEARYEDVWAATSQVLAEEQLRVRNSDPIAGVIYFDSLGDDLSSADINNLVARYTTKKVSGFSTWQVFRLQDSSAATVRRMQPGLTAVTLQFNYLAYNGYSGRWRPLPSNGSLESIILNAIGKRVKTIVPLVTAEQAAAPKITETSPDRVAGQDGRSLIRRFLRAGAAIENAAPESETSKLLLDAQVALEEYALLGGRREVEEPLRKALGLYRAGDAGEGRALVREAASVIFNRSPPMPKLRIRRPHRSGPIVR